MEAEKIKLTQYSHGAGCGCKIAPAALREILHTDKQAFRDEKLLVGHESNDDAAVRDMGDGSSIISTADFFMPIVDDPYDFGRIAAANSISDVYAMGGTPIMAIGLLGWPVGKLETAPAKQVIEGARSVCAQAGIALAGGHSIDTMEPMFGLSVTGTVHNQNLKRNNTAKENDLLFVTKRYGVGIYSTAQKKGLLTDASLRAMVDQMTALNSAGQTFGTLGYVHAMTDTTGFGILGHALEMAAGSGLTAELFFSKVPLLPGLGQYIEQNAIPGGTRRNWASYRNEVAIEGSVDPSLAEIILCDPQTNGGLLVAVAPEKRGAFIAVMKTLGLKDFTEPVGRMVAKRGRTVVVG